MPKSYQLSNEAQDDLEDILLYISRDSLASAKKVNKNFSAAFLDISKNPHIGHKRDDLTQKNVRFWNLYSYQIIYNPDTSPLQIVRILSGYRDIAGIIKQ
jgi:plasmid stabilization system protein ParE